MRILGLFLLLSATQQPSKAVDTMGPDAVAIVREPQRVDVGALRIIGAAKAEEQRFRTNDLIAGYPLKGPSHELSAEAAKALGALVLDAASYDDGPVQRCANKTLTGARFTAGDAKVELAFGQPCAQVVLVFRKDGAVISTGGRVTPEAAASIADFMKSTR